MSAQNSSSVAQVLTSSFGFFHLENPSSSASSSLASLSDGYPSKTGSIVWNWFFLASAASFVGRDRKTFSETAIIPTLYVPSSYTSFLSRLKISFFFDSIRKRNWLLINIISSLPKRASLIQFSSTFSLSVKTAADAPLAMTRRMRRRVSLINW